MAFASFCIEIPGGQDMLDRLNQFLTTHQIVSKQQTLVTREGIPYMLVWLEYVAAKSEVASIRGTGEDKPDVWLRLTPAQREQYDVLREKRKQLAQMEHIKPFVIFTNEQLGEMVKRRVTSLSGLKSIPEIGKGRVEKYGKPFLETLQQLFGTDGCSEGKQLSADSQGNEASGEEAKGASSGE